MKTKLIRGLYNLTDEDQGGVLTIGNFDGVHRGHQALVKRVITLASERRAPAIVITFEPHPFEVFEKNLTISRLTRLREKFAALANLTIDRVVILPFNAALASKSAEAFVKDILVDHLKIQHIVIGDDFRFGQKRLGDFSLLQALGKQYGLWSNRYHW